MGGKDMSYDIFINIGAERLDDLLGVRGQPIRGLRRFSSTMAWMNSGEGPFGPGLLVRQEEYSNRYIRCLMRR
jgi:hypothetical protein